MAYYSRRPAKRRRRLDARRREKFRTHGDGVPDGLVA